MKFSKYPLLSGGENRTTKIALWDISITVVVEASDGIMEAAARIVSKVMTSVTW